MHASPTVAGQRRGPRARVLLVAVLVLAFTGATASSAFATLGIQSFNNPAGDPTVQTYTLIRDGQPIPAAELPAGNPFTLVPGQDENYGPPQGTYIWKASPAPGWKVIGIVCSAYVRQPGGGLTPRAARAGEFAYDVANGQVTVNHLVSNDGNDFNDDDQVCAFTNGKASGGGGGGAGGGTGGGGGGGISPTLPGGAGSTIGGPALLNITAGKFVASIKLSLGRQSVVTAKLLKGKTVVGSARIVKKAGTYRLKVFLKKKYRERWVKKGKKQITLNLKITVVGSGRQTRVFRSGVIVKLA